MSSGNSGFFGIWPSSSKKRSRTSISCALLPIAPSVASSFVFASSGLTSIDIRSDEVQGSVLASLLAAPLRLQQGAGRSLPDPTVACYPPWRSLCYIVTKGGTPRGSRQAHDRAGARERGERRTTIRVWGGGLYRRGGRRREPEPHGADPRSHCPRRDSGRKAGVPEARDREPRGARNLRARAPVPDLSRGTLLLQLG